MDLPLVASQGLFFSDSLLVYFFDGVEDPVEELHATVFVFFEQDVFKHEDLFVDAIYLVLEFDEVFSVVVLLDHNRINQLTNDFSHFVFNVEELQLVVIFNFDLESFGMGVVVKAVKFLNWLAALTLFSLLWVPALRGYTRQQLWLDGES